MITSIFISTTPKILKDMYYKIVYGTMHLGCCILIQLALLSIVCMAPRCSRSYQMVIVSHSGWEDATFEWNTIELLSHGFNIF